MAGVLACSVDEPEPSVSLREQALEARDPASPGPEAVTDCGGAFRPPVISLSLAGWPSSDEAAPRLNDGDAFALAVSNDSDREGTVSVRASASSQQGASTAVVYVGRIGALEVQEIAVTLDALDLPVDGLDFLGQIVLSATLDDGAAGDVSDTLTLYFAPGQAGIDVYDEAAKTRQLPDSALTEAGRAVIEAAVDAYGALERPASAPSTIGAENVGFAYLGSGVMDEGTPDDRVFDDRGGAR